MECPTCRAEVSGKFCGRCGSAAPVPPKPSTPVDLCPSCGGRVGPGAKFCGKCATPLTRAVGQSAIQSGEQCLHCGSQLKPGAKFCKSCGNPASSSGSGPDSAGVLVGAPTAPAPVDPVSVSPSSSPAPWETPPVATGILQPELLIGSNLVSTTPSSEQGPVPPSLPELEGQRTPPPKLPAASSGFWGKNKAILLCGVAVLGLALGGLTYWFVLRKPEVNRVLKKPTVSRPATAARDKPSPAQSATPGAANSAMEPQAIIQPKKAPATGPNKAASEYPGGVSTTAVPAVPVKSGAPPPSAPARDFSGKWQGEYTNHDTNQIAKVSLQIFKDSRDLITGTLIFDSEGTNSAACAIRGVYNPQTRFMLLDVSHCKGHPPAYLPGKIGFTSVEPTDRRVFGVDPLHNSLLHISRQ
jgi:Double zinc ribbon